MNSINLWLVVDHHHHIHRKNGGYDDDDVKDTIFVRYNSFFFFVISYQLAHPVMPEASSLAFNFAVHANGFGDISLILDVSAQSIGRYLYLFSCTF